MSSVLVVEDDWDTRDAIRSVLEEAGYTVLTAADGQEALHILFSAPVSPSAVVLDLMMPVLSGWEFLSIVRSYHRARTIPVVIISASGYKDPSVRSLKKPVKLPELLKHVAAVVH